MNASDYKELLDILQAAYKESLLNGGIASYTLTSGQGETQVKKASTEQLLNQILRVTQLYNEASAIETGTNINSIGNINLGVFR